jgi:hypothetical protein
MNPTQWAALIVSIISIVTAFGGLVRWLVKHYLNELKPNSGSSIKDAVCRLEEDHKNLQSKVDKMYDILLTFMLEKNK